MGSTFGGVAYFDSGPQRFAMGRRGELTRGPFVDPNTFPVSQWFEKDLELAIFQTGRLVAPDAPSLWSLVDAIVARAEQFTPDTLVDTTGRSWSEMYMLRFTPEGPIDFGRAVSQAYSVFYLRFGT